MTVQSERDALLLAVLDMEQTIAAAQMLAREAASPTPDPEHLFRLQALETAIAVCYVRPLRGDVKESMRVVEEEVLPTDPVLHEMHNTIVRMRNQVYAHTDAKRIRGR